MKILKKYFETHKTQAEILRFLIVGGFATIIDFFMTGVAMYAMQPSIYDNFFLVFYGGPDPATWAAVIGTGIGFCSGLIFSYFLSCKFVFNEKGKSQSGYGFFMFCLLSFIGLGISLFGMWFGQGVLGGNAWVVKIIVSIITTIYNYVSKRLVLFRNSKKSPAVAAATAKLMQESDPKTEETPSITNEHYQNVVLKELKEEHNGQG